MADEDWSEMMGFQNHKWLKIGGLVIAGLSMGGGIFGFLWGEIRYNRNSLDHALQIQSGTIEIMRKEQLERTSRIATLEEGQRWLRDSHVRVEGKLDRILEAVKKER